MRMLAFHTGEFRSCTQTLHENSGIIPLNTPQQPNCTARDLASVLVNVTAYSSRNFKEQNNTRIKKLNSIYVIKCGLG
jgi:hypothetical protein